MVRTASRRPIWCWVIAACWPPRLLRNGLRVTDLVSEASSLFRLSMSDNDIVLVTGANGWLGRRVVRALTQGHPEMGALGAGGRRVRMLVRPGETADDLIALGAEMMEGDVRDAAALRTLCRGTTGGTLIHLAGVIHPLRGTREFTEVNFEGTKAVVTESAEARC